MCTQVLRGLGFFGSGAAVQFTPSMVFRTALAAAGVAPSSPSQVDHASSSRIAGMRGSSSWDLIVRRMSSFASTVTATQTNRAEAEQRSGTQAAAPILPALIAGEASLDL